MRGHPLTVLLAALVLSGCASSAHRIDHSRPPVDQARPLLIEPLSPVDQLPYTHAFHGEFVGGQSVRVDETFELLPSSQVPNDPCNHSVLDCAASFALAMVLPVIVVPVGIVALPFIAAAEKKEREAAVAAAAAESAGAADPAPPSDLGIEPGSPVMTEHEVVVPLPPEERAKWLADVVLDGEWSTSLDNAYISALYEALAWNPPVPGVASEGEGSQPDTDRQLRAGISKVMLLEASTGAQTSVVCARFLLQQGGDLFRYFETCHSTALSLAASRESPSSADALKSALVSVARDVSRHQVKALTGQREFAQGRL